MARTELRNHAKFKRLVRRLKLPPPYVMGLLETMWHQGYESGNSLLGDSKDVELAAEWPGKTGVFFRAIKVDWLDEVQGSWHIHDLADHAPEYVRKKLARRINDLQQKTSDIIGQTADIDQKTAVNDRMTSNRHRQVTDPDPDISSAESQQAGPSARIFDDPNSIPYPLFPVAAKPGTPNAWALPPEYVEELSATYPAVDVPTSCRAAWQWVRANMPRRKTANGMRKFLNGWMSRAQNESRGNNGKRKQEPQNGRANDDFDAILNRTKTTGATDDSRA